MSFDHVYSTRCELLPVEHASNPIKKVVGYPINCLATIAPVGAFCLAHHYRSTQSTSLIKTTDLFFSP